MRRRSLDGAALRMLSFGGLAGRPLGSSPPAGNGGGPAALDDGAVPSQQQQLRRQWVQQHAAAASAAAAAGQQPPSFGGLQQQQGQQGQGQQGQPFFAGSEIDDNLPLSRRAISLAFPPGAGSEAVDLRRMLRTGYLLPPLPPVREEDGV